MVPRVKPASTRKLAQLLVFALATCGSRGVLAQSSSTASISSRVVSSVSSATTATASATARPAPEAPSLKTTTVQLPPLYACEYSTWTCVPATIDPFSSKHTLRSKSLQIHSPCWTQISRFLRQRNDLVDRNVQPTGGVRRSHQRVFHLEVRLACRLVGRRHVLRRTRGRSGYTGRASFYPRRGHQRRSLRHELPRHERSRLSGQDPQSGVLFGSRLLCNEVIGGLLQKSEALRTDTARAQLAVAAV